LADNAIVSDSWNTLARCAKPTCVHRALRDLCALCGA